MQGRTISMTKSKYKASYFDYDGNPIDVLEWGRLFEDKESAQIALDIVGTIHFKTFWIGTDFYYCEQLNKELGKEVSPNIYFTVVTCVSNDIFKYVLIEIKYPNRELAISGHKILVKLYREYLENQGGEL
jgi:hypothetical protein